MPTFVFRDGQLIDKRHAPPMRVKRSSLSAPMIISDQLPDTWNPANGQTYDSRSAYYRAVKDMGCEVVGNDSCASRAHVHTEPEGVEQSISDAIDRLSA